MNTETKPTSLAQRPILRILADENIAQAMYSALQVCGADVVRVRVGVADRNIIAQAQRERRLILTEDTDFGDLAFAERLPVPGIILLRAPSLSVERRAELLTAVIAQGTDFEGVLTVIEPGGVRRRPLPVLKGPDEAS